MTFPEMPSFGLHGKRALVTGGSRGLGFACAIALAHARAEVWIAARDRQTLEAAAALAAEHGRVLHPVALDITDVAQVGAVLAELPVFDILVNRAVPGCKRGQFRRGNGGQRAGHFLYQPAGSSADA